MIWVGIGLTALAAGLHGYIFWMESFGWTKPSVRAVFGTSVSEAEATAELAYNQGFYNLFLALIALAGVVLRLFGHSPVGEALMLAGCGAMTAAAVVLWLRSPRRLSAALKQGVIPLLAIKAVVAAMLMG